MTTIARAQLHGALEIFKRLSQLFKEMENESITKAELMLILGTAMNTVLTVNKGILTKAEKKSAKELNEIISKAW